MPSLHTLPAPTATLPRRSLFAGPVHHAPGCSCSLGAARVCEGVWLLSHLSQPMPSQSCHLVAASSFPQGGRAGVFSIP